MNKSTKTKTAALVAACGLLGAAGTGAALAYLTDGETTTNTFTVGDVSIEALEPGWPGNDARVTKDIVPNQELPKNPLVDNKGVNDAIVFMTVDSPMESITVIKNDGTVETAKSVNEIFWYKDEGDGQAVHQNHFDTDNWQELTAKEMYVKVAANGTETAVSAANLQDAYDNLGATDKLVKRYVFGYKTKIEGSSPNDGSAQNETNKKTSNLFDKVQLKNMLENEIDETPQEIIIRTFAIQASEVLEGTTGSVDLTDTLSEANLGKIYDVYVRQNSTGDDASGLKIEGLRNVDSITGTTNGASGSTDEHVNRWDGTQNVDSPNNIQP
jgi:predicted ribosomally synthesized peptide with SipW-like signal peptide